MKLFESVRRLRRALDDEDWELEARRRQYEDEKAITEEEERIVEHDNQPNNTRP